MPFSTNTALTSLQQLLPFTVLKPRLRHNSNNALSLVATALTVYGIETPQKRGSSLEHRVATALTVYGIETPAYFYNMFHNQEELQQLLPFTVLKQ